MQLAASAEFNPHLLWNEAATRPMALRPPRAVERQSALTATGMLEATPRNEFHLLHRSPIVGPLAQLQLHPPIGVYCDCAHLLGYVAVVAGTAHIRSGHGCLPPGARIGGVWDLTSLAEPEVRRFDPRVHDAENGQGNVEPDRREDPGGLSGYADRRHYLCPDCDTKYTVTNAFLLRRFLRAVIDEWAEFALGEEPDLTVVRERNDAKRLRAQQANKERSQ